MNERDILRKVQADLQLTPRGVIYLEGKTDVPAFFGLLGIPLPTDPIHQNVGIRGLKDASGSGSATVIQYVRVARSRNLPVYGILDGDGRSLSALAAEFDVPHRGPLFSWKGYCIENLLVKTGWPTSWG